MSGRRTSRARAVYYDRRGWWSDDTDEDAYADWLDARDGRGLSPRERLEAELAALRRAVNRDPKHAPRRTRERLSEVEAELAGLDPPNRPKAA